MAGATTHDDSPITRYLVITATPVAAPPVPTMPAPMPTTPTPVTAAPVHFLRLETIDFVTCGDGRLGIRIGREPTIFIQRMRHQRRGLGAGGKRSYACCRAKRNFKKIPAFHDLFPTVAGQVMQARVSPL